jgi:hypothetical protein
MRASNILLVSRQKHAKAVLKLVEKGAVVDEGEVEQLKTAASQEQAEEQQSRRNWSQAARLNRKEAASDLPAQGG